MFTGNMLRDAIISGANNIYKYRTQVDELNVFPVPDGDTGTNMSMSIGNAARALENVKDLPAGEVASIASNAILRGARGNSGVITSLLFRGLAKGLKGENEVTGENLTKAFELGVAAAYKAVMKPTEGTILTVARVASEKASAAASEENDPLKIFEIILSAAKETLEMTPELLPTLKKAGVVDAGGMGLIKIFEGMYQVFAGGEIVKSDEIAEADAEIKEEKESSYAYFTEFIVNRSEPDAKSVKDLSDYLSALGDSLSVAENGTEIKVSLHTDHPGKAIERGIKYGILSRIQVENTKVNKNEAKTAATEDRTEIIKPAKPEKHFGFVSVSIGDGLNSLFKDLGVDIVVSGGQTMNPSTDDILRAVEATPAETVFVLPNNKNIIMAAEQAVPLSTKKIIVVHTKTIPMGISAMLSFDESLDDEQNAINMQNAGASVTTGQITFAARDSEYDGHKIKKNDLLCIENGKVAFTETDLAEAVAKLSRKMCKKEVNFLTLYYGEDVNENEAERIYSLVKSRIDSKIEITLINGGQPVYYFYLSAE